MEKSWFEGVQFRLSDSMFVCTNIFTCPRGSWRVPKMDMAILVSSERIQVTWRKNAPPYSSTIFLKVDLNGNSNQYGWLAWIYWKSHSKGLLWGTRYDWKWEIAHWKFDIKTSKVVFPCCFLYFSNLDPQKFSLGTGRLLGAVSSKINTACNTCPVIWLVMWWRETGMVLFPSFNANIRRTNFDDLEVAQIVDVTTQRLEVNEHQLLPKKS